MATLISVSATLKALNNEVLAKTNAESQRIIDGATAELEAVLPLSANVFNRIASELFLYSWMIVMLATFAEAYVATALDILVSAGLAGAASQKIGDDLKAKWIKNLIRSGGPSKWIDELKKLGVTGYADGLGKQMQHTWDQRHQIIHPPKPEVFKLNPDDFFNSVNIVNSFVETTDVFVRELPTAGY